MVVARELPPKKGFMGMCCPRGYGFGLKRYIVTILILNRIYSSLWLGIGYFIGSYYFFYIDLGITLLRQKEANFGLAVIMID